jgi:hypothetical protein
MIRLLSVLILACVSAAIGFGASDPADSNADTKKSYPPKPEAGGLRLEVNATLDDIITSDAKDWRWSGAYLSVEVALHNISTMPITVPTTAYDAQPTIVKWPASGEGLERIEFRIDSPRFQGKPTAFVAARFSPVVLAPGEYVLLLKHQARIPDRKHADAIKEVYVSFGVERNFTGPKDWWREYLGAYAAIQRRINPDKEIEQERTNFEKYAARKEAEKDPNYGKAHAARIAALIASSDLARIRGEEAKKGDEIIVRDPEWIRRVSEAIAAVSLSESTSCFCIGWRTAYFQQKGEVVVSVAAIHGNQLRIHWKDEGGDYPIDEASWKAVSQALELPVKVDRPPELTPGEIH